MSTGPHIIFRVHPLSMSLATGLHFLVNTAHGAALHKLTDYNIIMIFIVYIP